MVETYTSETNQRVARFCHYCGSKLDEGARFCKKCGKSVAQMHQAAGTTPRNEPPTSAKAEPVREDPRTKRKTVYEGEVHKCPNCGDIMEPFEIKCDVCGYDRRNAYATTSLKEFELKYEQAYYVDRKIDLIKTFAIPNAQEDILEFAVLAAMNIDLDAYDMVDEWTDEIRLSNAWLAKLEQAHEKAELLFNDTPIWEKIHGIYIKRTEALSSLKEERSRRIQQEQKMNLYKKVFGSGYTWALIIAAIGGILWVISEVFGSIDSMAGVFVLLLSVLIAEFTMINNMDKKKK